MGDHRLRRLARDRDPDRGDPHSLKRPSQRPLGLRHGELDRQGQRSIHPSIAVVSGPGSGLHEPLSAIYALCAQANWRTHAFRCEPLHYAESFIRLFNAPEFLLDRYSKDQLEEGFSAMVSPIVEGRLDAAIWSDQLAWEARERLLQSMYRLFASFFAREPLKSASYMGENSP